MITVIKNVDVYSPKYLGKKQVVIASDKFQGVYDDINIPENFVETKVVDGTGKVMMPGFIDSHVHLIGGGGEGGYFTRTPEIKFSELTTAGITTVVGCLGTDSVCRNMTNLLAKTRALTEEGISAYCYTGSYEIPVQTVTENIKKDIMLIDKIIGVGEIALSDNRSSQPSFEEFVNVVAQARVGGLLSGKCGIVDIHLGSGSRKLDMLFSLLEETEIPASQLMPTHVNRSTALFNMGIDYMKKGGYIDLTTSSDPEHLEPGELRASEALLRIYKMGGSIENVTFTSDGNGSMPVFNENHEITDLGVCSVKSLYDEVRNAVLSYKVPLEEALKVITSNPARILKLKNAGEIKEDFNADFVMADKESLEIRDVCAKGRFLIKNNKVLVKGTFE